MWALVFWWREAVIKIVTAGLLTLRWFCQWCIGSWLRLHHFRNSLRWHAENRQRSNSPCGHNVSTFPGSSAITLHCRMIPGEYTLFLHSEQGSDCTCGWVFVIVLQWTHLAHFISLKILLGHVFPCRIWELHARCVLVLQSSERKYWCWGHRRWVYFF